MSHESLLAAVRPHLSAVDPSWRAGDVVVRAGSDRRAPSVWRIVANGGWPHDRLPGALPLAVRQPGMYGLVQPFSGRDRNVQLERLLDDTGRPLEQVWIVRLPDVEAEDGEAIHPDLLSFRPSATLQRALAARGMSVQRIEDGWGQVSFDRYPVLVTRLPTEIPGVTSPEALLLHIRLNINKVVNTSLGRFDPYEPVDEPIWLSREPVGAVIHIKMLDDGTVMCAESTPSRWRFVTVRSPRDGWHPVSGTREFGITATDGGFEVYTRGADRTTNLHHGSLFPFAYTGADFLWKSFQQGVAQMINSKGGAATVQAPMTDWRWWGNVRGSHTPTVPWL